jgi:hypothetical protein
MMEQDILHILENDVTAERMATPDTGKDRHIDRVYGDLVSQNRGEVARVTGVGIMKDGAIEG